MTDSPYLGELRSRSIPFVKRSAKNVYVLCPFHEDKNPSLSISIDSGVFRCWGCGEVGGFHRLIAIWDGIPESEAKKKTIERDLLKEAYDEMERFFSVDKPSFLYFNSRSFETTFSPAEESELATKYVEQRKLPLQSIDLFNLRWGTKGRYHDRVIVPIFDVNGKIASYAARSIHKDVFPKTRKPKTANFTLFGLYEWTKINEKLPWVVLVEGEWDAMYLTSFGIPAAATMGTAGLTDKQLSLLVKYTAKVILSYDGDEAGYKAMFGRHRNNHLTTKGDYDRINEYLPLEVVQLPHGKDPNDLSVAEVQDFYGDYVV